MKWILAVSTVAPVLLALGSLHAQETWRTSVSSTGGEGSGHSMESNLSGDGRHVAFLSFAPDLVPGDTNGRNDVFVHDRKLATTTRVSIKSGGQEGTGTCYGPPAISFDGRFVAFSMESKLAPGDGDFAVDFYVHDRDFDEDGIFDEPGGVATTLVGVSETGEKANSFCSRPHFSASGRFLVFTTGASNLIPGDTNHVSDIYVHDRDADLDGIYDEPGAIANVRVSVSSYGDQADGGSGHAEISSDGRFVVFESAADNLAPGDTQICSTPYGPQNCTDVFVHDRDVDQDGIFDEPGGIATVRLSLSPSGQEANGQSSFPSIADGGRWVAFTSEADNLVLPDANVASDVFVCDRDADQNGIFDEPAGTAMLRVSVASDGSEANGASFSETGALSDQGRMVTFASEATNLAGPDGNHYPDAFLRDRDSDEDGVFDEPGGSSTRMISVSNAGIPGTNGAVTPSVSADGAYVTFASTSPNLVPGDTNAVLDVFVHGRELTFDAEPRVANPGGTVALSVWAGLPDDPISIWAVSVNGAPTFHFLLLSRFAGNGQWSLSVPVIAAYSGLEVTLLGIGVAATHAVVRTNQETIAIQ